MSTSPILVGYHPQCPGRADHDRQSLLEMEEGLVDEAWLHRKPKWGDAYRGLPISFAMVWRREG